MKRLINIFIGTEAASGILLIFSACLAMLAANSPLLIYYKELQSPSVCFFINDGLMTLFFLVIGIEIKVEMVNGTLSSHRQRLLPCAGALGGIIVPAVIFCTLNWHTQSIQGWAVPTATDIAFSLGVLSLFGKRIAPALRTFLMSIAILDDLAAIAIITFFYNGHLAAPALVMAAVCIMILYIYSKRVTRMTPYLFAGAALWVSLINSGIHPTMAGVLLGILIPTDLGKRLLSYLHAWVTFLIIPVFAFCNAGITFGALPGGTFSHPIMLGIAFGLFFGKQFGILIPCLLLIRAKITALPAGVTLPAFYAVCIISGIGFTMSLFISGLAFSGEHQLMYSHTGIIAGSLASAICGAILLAVTIPSPHETL